MTSSTRSVLLLGATGSIGHATAKALIAAGHEITAPVRPASYDSDRPYLVPSTLTERDLFSLMTERGCDAVISCVASRSGRPEDARAIDLDLNSATLRAALSAGIKQFVLLSAICVQKPKLAFQHAKLSFEKELQGAAITWSIVRPTAYFKSLSGQLDRLRQGKPFLLFGDGELTACKPISNEDLAAFQTLCLSDASLHYRILPIGGPGPAITPLVQGEMMFRALGQKPRFRHVPVSILSTIIAGSSLFGIVSPVLRDKAELARIGRYYATESMLLWDATAGRYDADATPEFGEETLADHYKKLVMGEAIDDRGAHSVF